MYSLHSTQTLIQEQAAIRNRRKSTHPHCLIGESLTINSPPHPLVTLPSELHRPSPIRILVLYMHIWKELEHRGLHRQLVQVGIKQRIRRFTR